MELKGFIQECMKEGRPWEGKAASFLSKWYEVRFATEQEDCESKTDLVVSRAGRDYRVQVKMPSKTGNVFVEHMAVDGRPGWLNTCDVLLKWLSEDQLIVVKTADIRSAAGDPSSFATCYAREAKGRWFRRHGRQDIVRELSVSWLRQYANAKLYKL